MEFTSWDAGLHLAHHGIKGQKWGVRRYQNPDGTLTAAGRQHYGMSDGGSRKASRQFNRQMRKLNRLQKRTDVELQKQNIEKYDRRAQKAMKIGNTAVGIAAAAGGGAYGLNRLAKAFDDKIVQSNKDERRRDHDLFEQYHDTTRNNYELAKSGAISEKFQDHLDNAAYHKYKTDRQNMSRYEYNSRVDNANKRDRAEVVRDVAKYTSYAAAGTAAASYGVAAYNKIQSHLAKKRITDAGHQKAVAKYEQQYSKMMNQFANTPYSDLLKKQKKSNS